jgi:hypothetical protein
MFFLALLLMLNFVIVAHSQNSQFISQPIGCTSRKHGEMGIRRSCHAPLMCLYSLIFFAFIFLPKIPRSQMGFSQVKWWGKCAQ